MYHKHIGVYSQVHVVQPIFKNVGKNPENTQDDHVLIKFPYEVVKMAK